MQMFDTKIQVLKYKVLKEVARHAWAGTLTKNLLDLPKQIVPGNRPTMRCCVFKERAILTERIKLAMGGNPQNPNVIEVIEIACDECPVGGFEVTNACRGCLAHRCEDVCKFGAISFDQHQRSVINKDKCKECGACAKVCPYNAIMNFRRPCEVACKVKAISMNEDKQAKIDEKKCTYCGACVYQCPFGAISDKSYILEMINLFKMTKNNQRFRIYAVIAPAIASQFQYAKLGQVLTGLRKLGFYEIVEASLGADIVAFNESKELVDKGFLMSSCCPAFVDYVENAFPALAENLSHNLSPMATISKKIKSHDPDAKVVFIGPCTAKKFEWKKENVRPYVDCVITFEELQALFDSRGIDITKLEEGVIHGASNFGRNFARSCGVSEAIEQGLKEHEVTDFTLKAVPCDGIEACKLTLQQAARGNAPGNFIEGMACVGGCIGGAGCLTHSMKSRREIEKYSQSAEENTIAGGVAVAKKKLKKESEKDRT